MSVTHDQIDIIRDLIDATRRMVLWAEWDVDLNKRKAYGITNPPSIEPEIERARDLIYDLEREAAR